MDTESSVGVPRASTAAALLLLVAIVVTIGRPLVGIGSLHAADTLQTLDPWAQSADDDVRPDNTMVSDTVDAVVPMRLSIAARARDGDLAMWASTQGGGSPALAVPNSSMFSPLSLPWWLAPGHAAPALAKALQLLVAAGGLFLFARRVGASRTGALVGALAFVNAGHLVVWTTWPQSNVVALAPWLLWSVHRAVDEPGNGGWWPVPLVGAAMWLEGFPSVTLWAHVLAASWAVALLRRRPARRSLAIVGAMGVGVGLAAFQLVPFALRIGELSLGSARAAKAGRALPVESVGTALFPDLFGSSGSGVWYGPANEVELQAFVGMVALVLVAAAWTWGRRRLPVAAPWWRWSSWSLAIITAMIILPPVNALVQQLPVVGGNQTGRLRGLVAMLLAVLVALGFDAVRSIGAARSEDRTAGRVRPSTLAWVVVPALVLVSPLLLRARDAAEAVGRDEFFRTAVAGPLVVLAAAWVLVWVAVRSRQRWRAAALVLLPVLLAVEVVGFARGFLPRIDTEDFYPRTEAHDVVADLIGSNRFAAGGLAMYPGTTNVYGLRSVTAHAAMPAAWRSLLQQADPASLDRNNTFPIFASTATVAASDALDVLGVSHFVTEEAVPVFGDRDAAQPADAPLATGAPINGIEVDRGVLGMLADHDPPVALGARIFAPDGTVVAAGERRLGTREVSVWLSVAMAPTDVAAPPTGGRIEVFLRLDPLQPGLTVPIDPSLPVRAVRVADDGLAVVAVPDVVVYRRPQARQRIRVEGADGNVLDAAEVEIVEDLDDELSVVVTTAERGALVVADARSGGHRATVDGIPVDVGAAHGALLAVNVPPGTHTIEVWFEPEGLRFGATITVLAMMATWAAGFSALRATRGRRAG